MEAKTIVGEANTSAVNAERIPLTDLAPSSASDASTDGTPLTQAEFQAQHDAAIKEISKDNTLVGFVTSEWDLSRTYRMSNNIDTKLLDALTARQGEYGTTQLAAIRAIGGSEIYDRILTECCRSAETFINDAMSADGTPWRFVAQRVTKIPENRKAAFLNKALNDFTQDAIAKGTVSDDPDYHIDMLAKAFDAELAKIHEANEASARKMEDLCYDQFREGGGWQALHEFVKDLCLYKTACIKGPIPAFGNNLEFKTNAQGAKKAFSRKVRKYIFKRVSPFDLFPAAGNEKMAKGTLTERLKMTVKDLLEYVGEEGWFDDALRATVERYGEAGYQYFTSFDSTRMWLEEHGTWLGARKGVIECLEYWGYARGDRISQNTYNRGVKIEPSGWYHIHAIVCADQLLFCAILDDRYDIVPYFADSFCRIAGSAWGDGISDLIEDKESMACACQRNLADNMAFTAGPIEIVDYTQLPPGQAIQRPSPRMVIQVCPENGKTTKPVEFISIPSNAAELLNISDKMRARAYDMIGMAPPDMGTDRAAGAGRTSSGLEDLFGHRNKGIRGVVYGIDTNVMRPLFTALYRMNMLYHTDNAIKAECEIVPQGISAAIAREMAGQKQMSFLTMLSTPNSPFARLMTNSGKAAALREMARMVYLPGNIIVDEHTAAEMDKSDKKALEAAEAQASAASQPQPAGQPPMAAPAEPAPAEQPETPQQGAA